MVEGGREVGAETQSQMKNKINKKGIKAGKTLTYQKLKWRILKRTTNYL